MHRAISLRWLYFHDNKQKGTIMLRPMPQTYTTSSLYPVARIALFTGLTIIAARMQVELGGPVPFTFQPMAVLLAGMVLGAREGMASQLAYVGLIALGLPVDARGLGAAAFFGPTGGYLIGFVMAAWATGALVEKGNGRLWQRGLAGIVGITVIYGFGVVWLRIYGGWVFGMSWDYAITEGAVKFLGYDLIKVGLAALLHSRILR
jgi:biotin transport system substrate-specific component